MTSGTVAGVSPGVASYLYYYFNDLNKDNIAQRNEIDFNYGLVAFSGVDPKNPAATPINFRRWDSGLKAPKTDELVLGAERELLANFSIAVNGTYRKLNDFVWLRGEKTRGAGDFYTSADYVLHAPVTAALPNGRTVSLPYYTLKSDVAVPTFFVYQNRPGYHQTYKGLELTATKRMSNRWMLRGNVTLQDWKQHVSASGIVDPTVQRVTGTGVVGGSACAVCNDAAVLFRSTGSGNKGNVYINSKWAYSITGLYQIPIVETSVGFNLNGRQGYALPYVFRVSTPRGEGSKLLLAEGEDIDRFRSPNVTELDIRLAKDIHVSRLGLTLSIDGFNVLNRNTILQRDVTRLNSYAASDRVTEVLSPRVFRIGARLSY
jgi:hypothetical protein